MKEAAGGVGRGEVDDDGEERSAAEEVVQVYCAVGKEAGKEWRNNLRWVLANFPRSHRRLVLVLAHVHRPPRLINIMGAWVPVSQVTEHEVAAYRKLREDKASKALDDLVHICKSQQVHTQKVVVTVDDVTRGLVQLVEDHGVAELIMGAASDRAYTRKMRAPKSKKALEVQKKANPNCRISFVCKGNLICTREVSGRQSRAAPSTTSTSPRSSASDHSRSKSSPPHADGEPIDTTHDTVRASVRQAPSKDDIDNGATEHSVEEIAHEAAAEAAEADGSSPVRLQPIREGAEELSIPSRRGSDDASECRSTELELQVAGSERAMGSELDVKMPKSRSVLDVLRLVRRRREEPVVVEESISAVGGGSFLRFRMLELEKATNSFDKSARISGRRGAGHGGVYRGTLRRMSVAVKVISPDIAVDEVPFVRAVEAISRARHPNLVTLVGACPEARAVVHELVPGGSLEDRLNGEASPLPWHARCAIAYQTCSALSYLHSADTVHGDVRAANILFEDEQFSSIKLAGLDTSRLAKLKRAGTVALAYVDPRYLATGELTPQCDVHALGVVLLRLVTGKSASAAKKAAREAVTGGGRAWHDVVDARAGGWPMERATELAILGLKCCEVSDGRAPPRPAAELLEEALSALEAVTSTTPGRTVLLPMPDQ